MKKLLVTTVAASVLFSGAAFAADPWPIIANMSGVLATTGEASATPVDINGLGANATYRRMGVKPPAGPDSVSVTVDDRGRTSTTSTWVKK